MAIPPAAAHVEQPRRRRTGRIAVAAATAVLAVVVAAVAAVVLTRSDPDERASGTSNDSAAPPSLDWKWSSSDGDVVEVSYSDDTTFVLTSDEVLTALDSKSGASLWTRPNVGTFFTDVEHPGVVYTSSNASDMVVHDHGTRALDGRDGHQLWQNPNALDNIIDGRAFTSVGGPSLGDPEVVGVLDLDTGKELWTRTTTQYETNGAILVATQGRSLTSVDLDTGKELWSAPLPPSFTDTFDYAVAAKTFTAVFGGETTIGYDNKTGRKLWEQPNVVSGAAGLELRNYTADQVVEGDREKNRWSILSRDGTAVQLSVEADSPWFVPIGDEGQYCLVQGPPNQLHTSDGSPIGPVYSEPTTEPGDRGLYTLVSNHLTFRSVPGGKVLWRLRLPAEVRGVSYLSPWPGHLYVEYGETVYAYS